jgi:hypothetical protein
MVIHMEGLDMARAMAIMVIVLVNFEAMIVILAGVSLSLMAHRYSTKAISKHLKPYLMKRSHLLLITGTPMSRWSEAGILHFLIPAIRSQAFVVPWDSG